MESIWKETLRVDDTQKVELPVGAKILCIQEQDDKPQIWFITPKVENVEKETRTFFIYGTGHPHDAIIGEYVGTFQLRGGLLVFHVFEDK